MCAFKLLFSLDLYSHKSHLKSFILLCTALICIFNVLLSLHLYSHKSHLKSFILLCTALICLCKLPFVLHLYSHKSHLKSFILLCSALICCKLNFNSHLSQSYVSFKQFRHSMIIKLYNFLKFQFKEVSKTT
jgi:hypothetical protein